MFQEVNDYALLKLLGRGAFGEVHLAESVDKDQYALKIIPVSKQIKDDAKKEAQMYVSFEHPNIVKAREFFFFKKEQYLIIILEYCPDGNLSKLIGKIDQDKSKEIIKQIVEGLVYLHDDKKTLHRDIKPDNILMLDGVPKIADLGISKRMRTESLLSRSCTPFYAAPEVFYEENYDFKADIWSLGIVFLELLSGKRITEMVKGIKPPGERADFPSEELLKQIKDETLRELVRRMLEKDPKKRLKSKQVLEELKGNKIKISNKKARIDEREFLTKMPEKQFIDLILIGGFSFPKLKNFYLANCQITDNALKTLASIPQLREKLPNLQQIFLADNQITDVGLKALAGTAGSLKNLQLIDFSSNLITDAGLKALIGVAEEIQSLRKIDFDDNEITDVGLKALAGAACKLKNLQEIYLSNNLITDVGLKALAGAAGEFKNLKQIFLNNNQITDVGLKTLTGAAGKFKNLREIGLSNNQITDAGLESMAEAASKFKNLGVVWLTNNQITDEGLKILAETAGEFKKLHVIYLAGNKATQKTNDFLKQAYKIKFEIYVG